MSNVKCLICNYCIFPLLSKEGCEAKVRSDPALAGESRQMRPSGVFVADPGQRGGSECPELRRSFPNPS